MKLKMIAKTKVKTETNSQVKNKAKNKANTENRSHFGYSYLVSAIFLLVLLFVNTRVMAKPVATTIQLIEYVDPLCPHCHRMQAVMDEIKKRYPNLKIIDKDTPMLSNQSWLMAEADLAAKQQGDFNRMHAMIMHVYPPSVNDVLRLIKHDHLQARQFFQDADSLAVHRLLENNIHAVERYSQAGVIELPVIFISNHQHQAFIFYGETNFSSLAQAIHHLHLR